MIIYENTAGGFCREVNQNQILDRLSSRFRSCMGHPAADNEVRSWQNSLQYMHNIVQEAQIPEDCGVLLEYNIPSTAKRIDFLISGHDEADRSNFVIIELKQWESAEATGSDGIVITYLNGGLREVAHPSYQASSYRQFLSVMNEGVYNNNLQPKSCAYLHNYRKRNPEPLLSTAYQEFVADSPVYFKDDTVKLQNFLRKQVGKGKGMDILWQIENGKIRPSKKLMDAVAEMFRGNEAFTLLDEQQVAFAQIIHAANHAKKKTVILVNGGPGTGKSVVAMNALCTLLNQGKNIRFVAPNKSFKEGLIDAVASKKARSKTLLKTIVTGSMSYYDKPLDSYDIIICDEAHRLKSTQYMYKGKSQVDDIIRAGRVSVLFVDDRQKIRPDDEGDVARIEQVAKNYGAVIKRVELNAQFRCSGADGYVNWLGHTLQLEETGNLDGWDSGSFDFQIYDTPQELYARICALNKTGKTARLVAGYAWPWTEDGNSDAQIPDVEIPEYNFKMPWNSRANTNLWACDAKRSNEIGCVHTVQGLEFDYVGVIIGNDLRYDEITGDVVGSYEDYMDKTGRKGLKNKAEELTRYICNIYRVLMTRGMQGCFVFCRDAALKKYLLSRVPEWVKESWRPVLSIKATPKYTPMVQAATPVDTVTVSKLFPCSWIPAEGEAVYHSALGLGMIRGLTPCGVKQLMTVSFVDTVKDFLYPDAIDQGILRLPGGKKSSTTSEQ